MKKALIFGLIGGIVLFSCTTEDEDVPNLGYDYYPLKTGNYIVYEVEEFIYDAFDGSVDTNIYLLKEEVDSAINVGQTSGIQYKLNRYTRLNDTLNWELKDQWVVHDNKENGRVTRTEEDSVLVKMAFPFTRGKSWDANAMNANSEHIYRALSYDLRWKVGDETFTRTSNIRQKLDTNLVQKIRADEIYARGVGLVYLVDIDLRLDEDKNIESGHDITWTYLEHGSQ